MAADRRVNAAGAVISALAEKLAIQILAHAVQALEFVIQAVSRQLPDRRNRMCVVGGELRVESPSTLQDAARAGDERNIGARLAGEDRVTGKTLDLGMLDLAVPVRALDQAHRQAVTGLIGKPGEIIDYASGHLEISLDSQAKPVPIPEALVLQNSGENVQRQHQPVRLFGIDGQGHFVVPRQLRKLEQPRRQLAYHPAALPRFQARVQRRQFYRNAGRGEDVPPVAAPANRPDPLAVGLEIALGIERG